MHKDHVFNHRRRRLLRTRIPRGEHLSAALVLSILVALVAWITTTRDDFDPTQRDLPVELIRDRSGEITLYNPPLKPWVEPDQQAAGAAFDLAPFPAGTLDDAWQPAGRIKRFQQDNLYQKIDGEAEKFIKQGFVELAYLVLRSASDGSEIAIELFDQGDLGGSLGIFADHTAGRPVEERDGVSYVTTGAGVIGRKGRYFFRIAGDRQSAAITDKAINLAGVFAGLGQATQTPARDPAAPVGFRLLRDRLGIAEADIQFEEDNVFQYDFARRFWFGDAGIDEQARLFVHIADTATDAKVLIDALVQEHSYEYDRVESKGDFTLFRHRFLGTYFAIGQRGRYVFGVEKLPDTKAVAALLARIRENLPNDAA